MVSRCNLSFSGPCFPPVPPSSLCPVSLLLSSGHAFLSAGEPLTGMCAGIGGKYHRQCWEASPLPQELTVHSGGWTFVVVSRNCPLSQVPGGKAYTPGFAELPERPFWCFLPSSSPAPAVGAVPALLVLTALACVRLLGAASMAAALNVSAHCWAGLPRIAS